MSRTQMQTARVPVLWLTGLSGAGKSTLAEATVARLRERGIPVLHLDGDSLRAGLCADLGFSAEDRMENVRRTAEVAKVAASQGLLTICSLIAPLTVHREEARRVLGERYVEVFVHCEIEECIRRDPKGLYARALAGELKGFTGIGSPYERPASPSLTVDTQAREVGACVDLLLAHIEIGATA